MRHGTFLEYKKFRYLKLATLVSVASIAAYAFHKPPVTPYGGTWLGYTLGTIGALLILMLLWFGVRKRQYSAADANLQGWLSAHVYMGASLIIIATLHTGFEVGWNVHTLAYVLMLAVIFSGFYGIYSYVRFPSMITGNMADDSFDSIMLKISTLDSEARKIAMRLPDNLVQAVQAAAQGTIIGGGVWNQVTGRQRNCPTTAALNIIQKGGADLKGDAAKHNHELYSVMLQRKRLVDRARSDISYRARMSIWLFFHVPLSIALLAALAAHIISVFFYW
jgi:hypothetical protein